MQIGPQAGACGSDSRFIPVAVRIKPEALRTVIEAVVRILEAP